MIVDKGWKDTLTRGVDIRHRLVVVAASLPTLAISLLHRNDGLISYASSAKDLSLRYTKVSLGMVEERCFSLSLHHRSYSYTLHTYKQLLP